MSNNNGIKQSEEVEESENGASDDLTSLESQLKPKQREALDLLINEHLTSSEIAEELGIPHTTIAYWRTEDSTFKQVLNQRLRLVIENVDEALIGMVVPLSQKLLDFVLNVDMNTNPEELDKILNVLNKALAVVEKREQDFENTLTDEEWEELQKVLERIKKLSGEASESILKVSGKGKEVE